MKAESLRLVFALTLPFVNLAMGDMVRMRFNALQCPPMLIWHKPRGNLCR
nr:MAG TPA_asm: hypothetical protein [Microviridae sp.]DAS90937.1 MAG TPA: hypothetical protein [Microviridae sp.]